MLLLLVGRSKGHCTASQSPSKTRSIPRGVISTAGTKGRASYVPQQDATAVARMRAAGAILLGKTNLPELSLAYESNNLIYGRTNNPYDLSRTPGGVVEENPQSSQQGDRPWVWVLMGLVAFAYPPISAVSPVSSQRQGVYLSLAFCLMAFGASAKVTPCRSHGQVCGRPDLNAPDPGWSRLARSRNNSHAA